MLKRLLLTSMVLGVAAVVADSDLKRVQLDAVAAHVNGDTITVSDVVRSSPELQRELATGGPSTELETLYMQALDGLIGRRLVIKAYADQNKVKIPEPMIQERIENIVAEAFHGDRTALLEALADDGMDIASWEEQIREQVIIQAMQSVRVQQHIRVSPVDIRRRYDEQREDYMSPAEADINMIVLDEDRDELAKELLEKLENDASFESLAKEHSVGSRASSGGARGWMKLDMLRAELGDAIRGNAKGGVTDVVTAGDKLYIIRVNEFRDARNVPFREVEPLIEQALRAEQGRRLYAEWVDMLRRDAYVKLVETSPF